MDRLNQALQAGYAAFQRGDLNAARTTLTGFSHPKAVHLLALVEKAAGNVDAAESLFEKAAKSDPNDPEIANNQAVLAMQMGRASTAEKAFRRALVIKPDFQQAATGLGRLLIDSKRWDDASAVYGPLLANAPQDVIVRYGYATVQLELGEAETAEAMFQALISSGNVAAEFRFIHARALLELGRIAEALDELRISYESGPSGLCLRVYAGVLWMTEDRQGFSELLESAAAQDDLVIVAADLYRQSGQPDKSVEILTAARGNVTTAVVLNSFQDLPTPLQRRAWWYSRRQTVYFRDRKSVSAGLCQNSTSGQK